MKFFIPKNLVNYIVTCFFEKSKNFQAIEQ